MRLLKKLHNLINDSSRNLRERVFIVLTLSAVSITAVALLGDIIYGENIVEIIVLIGTVISTPLMTYFGVKTGMTDQAAKVISLGIIFVIMPLIFIFGGGARGGAVPWMIFFYLYIGLVLSGVWLAGGLISLTLMVIATYAAGYYFPQIITYKAPEIDYLDSALGVIEVGFVCFIMTWFQRRLFMEENRRALDETKKVEEMNRSQSRFFSSMSHEIRTPINSILGLNEIILRQEDASEEIIKDAGNIQGAGRMLLALVNDILDISKIEAGKMDIVPVNYNLVSLISEIVNMMWLRAEQKGLELKIEVDPSLPAELFGDEVRIKQILINLMNNAVKYTREGTVTLHIEKEDIKEDQVLIIFSVIDTGMGIKQDAIPFLFDAFKRVDEEKNTKIEGTGLGLSIVKQLVDLMNGKITVNSVYTQGSTFQVALWQKVTRHDTVGDISITSYGSTKKGSTYEAGFTAPNARILIVDDNEMNLEVEKKLLAGTKISVDTVMSGAEAISLTLNNRYDVILMDHLMPEMDGIECLQYIRKQAGGLNNHAPIIALTANAGSENRELYSNSGFDGYLVKPVSGKQLEDTLLQHLPDIKVKMAEGNDAAKYSMSTARSYSRKIPLLITTSSLCDLPEDTLLSHQIDTIPFSLNNGGRMFYDNTEASSVELVRYMKKGEEYVPEPPTVEEFERFFGRELKKAHQVIYITVTTSISTEYERAVSAARAYENVLVYNSGLSSAAMGILVLLAYRMSTQGKSPDVITAELDRIKTRIHSSFFVDSAEYLTRKGFVGRRASELLSTLDIRPFIRIKNDSAHIGALGMGELKKAREKYINYALPRTSDPDPDVVMIIYVDQTADELKWIKERVLKRHSFSYVIFQRSCAAMSATCGSGAFGIAYIKKGEMPWNLSSLINTVEEDELPEDAFAELPEEETVSTDMALPQTVKEEEEEDHSEWYERIPGIDPEAAIKNSGSEDAFRTVLEIFYDSIEEKAQEIEKFFETGDWDNYTIKVHALKSSARLVGATDLGEEAQALEYAGGAKDTDFINAHHDELLEHLRGYIAPLEEIFAADKDDTESKTGEDGDSTVNEQFDQYLIESVYEALKEGTEARDDAMIKEIFGEISEYELPGSVMEMLDRIKSLFDSGDYDGMARILNEKDV